MDVIYGLIPMVLIAGLLVVVAFIWMAKNGHFDDMDGQANRILMDEEFEEDKPSQDVAKEQADIEADTPIEKDKTKS
ncbi:cbb3-type cytochrome oxidase assembly protein CcoS [Thiomicrorhabdus sediminis]|uniref:Cbb3-type cytochrome oxidase assembly protein CcoS n=1 Tax=Thiomicrorhabdus sediminis TaxID=2580412 RepID=A0A4P9K4Y4_9GAMM|nr:cbb3-type cytochrome oxidase assembly protein CcoS [Thiomicrorhabdus sediminis]QCU89286.1 cbb3-type cytochrome oxidase assembly protein CcoS [Thiomicrorhabdus sediminis]